MLGRGWPVLFGDVAAVHCESAVLTSWAGPWQWESAMQANEHLFPQSVCSTSVLATGQARP